jgi:hypothetical protein
VAQFLCHCEDCRAVTGDPMTALALFPAAGVELLEGEVGTSVWRTLPRTWCTRCGALLFGEPPGMGMRGVNGALRPAGWFEPAFHIRCGHAVAPVRDGLPHFKDVPPAFGGTDETVDW